MRIQERVNAHRHQDLPRIQFVKKYVLEITPIATTAAVIVLLVIVASLTASGWLPKLIGDAA
jgi:hypothetical protein